MKNRISKLFVILAALPVVAFAQSTYNDNRGDGGSSASWLPWTHNGYWGINLGKPDYDRGGNDPSLGGKLYTGGQINKRLGLEFGYENMGTLERNGGDVDAQGLNLSLVGTVPLDNSFDIFGKLGATYGWTDTDGTTGRNGDEDGLGGSYGVGAGLRVSRNTKLLLEWERHDFRFVGGKSDVDMVSLGLKFRF